MHALLRDGFERRCFEAGLGNDDLAGVARGYCFSEDFREGNKVDFPDLSPDGGEEQAVGSGWRLWRRGL